MTDFGRNPGPPPDRWLFCPRKANDLLVKKFLAFKTPLDEKFNNQIPLKYRFTPRILFDSVKSNGQKLGLWIDLTKTNRFYNKEFISQNDCKYVKIECQGHECAPTIDQTNTFIQLCKLYISKDPLSIIGVHCTHGFNRTGFLLVSFLVEFYDFSVEIALKQFAVVRPPGIYKETYIQELFHRYDDTTFDYAPLVPQLPDWCYNEETTISEPNCKQGVKRKRSSRIKENPTFMDGVPGVQPITDRDEIIKIRQKVKSLTRLEHDSFIGSQPVSMDRNNISLLGKKPYRVSWKADGTRYILFIEGIDEVYFIDRDNSIFKVQYLQFFMRKCSTQHLTNTILDGEMVIDNVDNVAIPRYLIYDIVYFEGNNVGQQPFYPIRLRMIEIEIIEPRRKAMEERRIIKENEPFSVRKKEFFDLNFASYLLGEKFAKKLTHEPDGLIFQPSTEPYTYGESPNVLKWKPLTMNSIDFKLQVNRVQNVGCLPEYIGNLLTGSGRVFGKIKCNKILRTLNNKIIECKLENNQWVFMRERTDKSFPNSDKTAEAVLESIRSPVTQRMLLEFIESRGFKGSMPSPMASPSVRGPRKSVVI